MGILSPERSGKTLKPESPLPAEKQAAFDSDLVEFKQADLSRQAGAEKAFDEWEFLSSSHLRA